MKNTIARAQQIVCLEEAQIKKLHALENKRDHLLANWNIQILFRKAPIKLLFRIPDTIEAQAVHAQRIEMEILKHNFWKPEADGNEQSVDIIHAFDWMIHHNQNKIVWTYAGMGGTGGLATRMKQSFAAVQD